MDVGAVKFDLLPGHALTQDEFQNGKFRRDDGKSYDPRGIQIVLRRKHGVFDDNDIGKNIHNIHNIKLVADKRIGGVNDLGLVQTDQDIENDGNNEDKQHKDNDGPGQEPTAQQWQITLSLCKTPLYRCKISPGNCGKTAKDTYTPWFP